MIIAKHRAWDFVSELTPMQSVMKRIDCWFVVGIGLGAGWRFYYG